MKVSSLLFVGYIGAVLAVATENEAGAEDDLFPEYSDTEYWGPAPNADGEEYAIPFEYGDDTNYGGLATHADGIGLGYGEFAYDTAPDNGTDDDGSFIWMFEDQMSIERKEAIKQMYADGEYDLTTYYLYYDESDYDVLRWNQGVTVNNSRFNKANPTLFLIYDWDMQCRCNFVQEVLIVLQRSEKYNVFCVAWSYYAGHPYDIAIGFVEEVGKYLARFIDYMSSKAGMSFYDLTLVGYGLGAHVAGHAGKNVKSERIDIIIGLDPAGPGFYFNNCSERLCSTDARYVQSIQTNGGDMFQLGFNEPLGMTTFYPDGGEHQLPCFGVGEFDCSHSFSWKYYAIALEMNNFCAVECDSYDDAQKNVCGRVYSRVKMGFPKAYNRPGIYYVPLLRKKPYGGCEQLF